MDIQTDKPIDYDQSNTFLPTEPKLKRRNCHPVYRNRNRRHRRRRHLSHFTSETCRHKVKSKVRLFHAKMSLF